MNPEDETDLTPTKRLLENQRPPSSGAALPALPDDLRRHWSAHFGTPRRLVNSHRRAWMAGLAAAAAIVAVFVGLHHVSPKSSPSSPSGATDELLSLPTSLPETDDTPPMSAITLALLRYEDPATAGLYVHR